MESMPMKTKRRNPFGEEEYRESKNIKNDLESIYDKTVRMLMQSSQQQVRRVLSQDVEVEEWTESSFLNSLHEEDVSCFVCNKEVNTTVPCSYCARDVCDLCVRQCEKCSDVFCAFCTTHNYTMRYDRLFCLSCNEEESRNEIQALRRMHHPQAMSYEMMPGRVH